MAIPNPNSLFQKLHAEAKSAGIIPNTLASHKWFLSKLSGMRQNIAERTIITDPTLKSGNRAKIGKMYAFRYDPKHKLTLPLYDMFPLILMVGPARGANGEQGFYGLNLHYLPPQARAVFFDRLMSFTNKRYDANTQIRLSYSMLKSAARLKAFAPCFHMYLLKHMKGFAVEIPATEWEIALFMPCENFK